MTAEHTIPRGAVEVAEAILATELMEQRLRSLAYRCVECSFVGATAEHLAGHYRVTRCSPEVRVVVL